MESKCIRHKMIVMELDNCNNFTLTKDMIEKSLETFKKKPIVATDGSFKDYRDNKIVDEMVYSNMCGVIEDVEFIDGVVIANCILTDCKFKKDRYDNWCLTLSDDKSNFVFEHVEIFI